MVAMAEKPWNLEQLMQSLSAIQSRNAYFKEEKTLAMLDTPLIVKGFLHFKAPDYLKRQNISPQRETYEISGDQLLIDSPHEGQRQLALSDYPLLRAFVESFRATLAGDLARLKQYYRVRLRGKKAKWVLSLKPLDEKMAWYVTVIRMYGRFNQVLGVETRETDGDRSIVKLKIKP
jgi:hypothetical protein